MHWQCPDPVRPPGFIEPCLADQRPRRAELTGHLQFGSIGTAPPRATSTTQRGKRAVGFLLVTRAGTQREYPQQSTGAASVAWN